MKTAICSLISVRLMPPESARKGCLFPDPEHPFQLLLLNCPPTPLGGLCFGGGGSGRQFEAVLGLPILRMIGAPILATRCRPYCRAASALAGCRAGCSLSSAQAEARVSSSRYGRYGTLVRWQTTRIALISFLLAPSESARKGCLSLTGRHPFQWTAEPDAFIHRRPSSDVHREWCPCNRLRYCACRCSPSLHNASR